MNIKHKINKFTLIIIYFIAIVALLNTYLYKDLVVSYSKTETAYFTDVDINAYYADSIYNLYNHGYIDGYGNGLFGVDNAITKSQALTIITRLSGNYLNIQNEYKTANEMPWDYAIKQWAIQQGLEVPNTIDGYATRVDIARYIVKVLDIPTNIAGATDIIFEDTNNIYVNTLYLNGIVNGVSNKNGVKKYNPNAYITRADTCVILSRVIGKEFISPDSSQIQDSDALNIANSLNFVTVWEEMLDNGLLNKSIDLGNIQFKNKDELNSVCSLGIKTVYEALSTRPLYEGYFGVFNGKYSCKNYDSYISDVIMTFTFKVNSGEENYKQEVDFVEKSLQETLNDLYSTGKLKKEMAEKDRALVISELISDYLQYDYTYSSKTAYDSLVNRKAVCRGYSALCTYLLQLDGINAKTVTGTTETGMHEWIKVLTKTGDEVYIDPTWMDTGTNGKYNTQWFWASRTFLEANQNWRVFDE